MKSRSGERGFALQTVIALVVVVGIVYLGVKIVPAFVNNYQFQDAVEAEAKLALINKHAEEDVRDVVFKKARSLDLPIKREQIKVELSGNGVKINCSYVVPVPLPGYTWNLHFDALADSRLL